MKQPIFKIIMPFTLIVVFIALALYMCINVVSPLPRGVVLGFITEYNRAIVNRDGFIMNYITNHQFCVQDREHRPVNPNSENARNFLTSISELINNNDIKVVHLKIVGSLWADDTYALTKLCKEHGIRLYINDSEFDIDNTNSPINVNCVLGLKENDVSVLADERTREFAREISRSLTESWIFLYGLEDYQILNSSVHGYPISMSNVSEMQNAAIVTPFKIGSSNMYSLPFSNDNKFIDDYSSYEDYYHWFLSDVYNLSFADTIFLINSFVERISILEECKVGERR